MTTNPYTFIGLVNDALNEVNEVQLTESNFATITGFHQVAKRAVNNAIRHIYNKFDNRWPFQWTEATLTLVPGTIQYTLDSAITYDWENFYIAKDAALDKPDAQELIIKDFEYYTTYFRENQLTNTDVGQRDKPTHVIRLKDNKVIFYKTPDATYTVKYHKLNSFTPLVNSSDVPLIPEQYRDVILTGALHFLFKHRDDTTNANTQLGLFNDEIGAMRRVLIPLPTNMRYI